MPTQNDTDQVFDGNGALVSSTPRVRDVTLETNYASLVGKAKAAIAANNTYIALPSPSAAATTAQVQRLSRECNALIRLLLNSYDVDDA